MIYTQSDLKTRINAGIQGKIDMLVSPQDTMNEAAREVLTEVSLRSTRRKSTLTPNLFNEVYEYTCPTDLMGNKIIDIPAQAQRADGEFTFVPSEQFRRAPRVGDISIDDFNGTRILLINSATSDDSSSIVSLEEVDTGPADWTALGDATNIEANSDDYVRGNASIEFDIGSGATTTAGIYVDGASAVDLSEYISHSASVFVYARITSTTNITNFKLRLGQSASAYNEFTATTTNDGTAFAAGWNLIRFDLTSPTATGSPNTTSIDYVALYMTKTAGKINEAGYMFNGLIAKKGKYANIKYYSKYPWQSSTGTYKENSTDASDFLNADTDEFDLIVKKGRVIAAGETDLSEGQIDRLKKEYANAVAAYKLTSPAEDKAMVSTYYDY